MTQTQINVTKGGIVTNYQKITEEITILHQQMELLSLQISKLPPGDIYLNKNGKYYRWYQSNGHTSTYIPKSNRDLARNLAIKKYLQYQLEYTSKEYLLLHSLLSHHNSNPNKAEDLLQNSPEYKLLLDHSVYEHLPYNSEWANIPFEQNPLFPEQLIHTSISKNMLRSKSEFMIDCALYNGGIAFRYECKLVLGDSVFYPDFTILHPKTGKLIYWEHFGMMDNYEYSNKAFNKLKYYSSNDLLLGNNLIATFETQKNPLTYQQIENVIDCYLLN